MYRCETLVNGRRVSDAKLSSVQVDAEIACLLADGWAWLIRESGWLSLWTMHGPHLAIVRFTR